jgi:hypothetical protein
LSEATLQGAEEAPKEAPRETDGPKKKKAKTVLIGARVSEPEAEAYWQRLAFLQFGNSDALRAFIRDVAEDRVLLGYGGEGLHLYCPDSALLTRVALTVAAPEVARLLGRYKAERLGGETLERWAERTHPGDDGLELLVRQLREEVG